MDGYLSGTCEKRQAERNGGSAHADGDIKWRGLVNYFRKHGTQIQAAIQPVARASARKAS
jgi:hypothetical protein